MFYWNCFFGILWFITFVIYVCHAMLCNGSAVMRCPSVMFVNSVKTNKDIFKTISPHGSQTILVFRTKRHGNILMWTSCRMQLG